MRPNGGSTVFVDVQFVLVEKQYVDPLYGHSIPRNGEVGKRSMVVKVSFFSFSFSFST